VETALGYHVLRVESRQDAREVSLEEARERIRDRLSRPARAEAERAFVAEILARAKVNHEPVPRSFSSCRASCSPLTPRGAEIVERVVAKVNGQIITLSEFQARQIAAAQGARVDPANIGPFLRQNNARILQDAIDEILILQKAQDAGIRAPSQWIDEAIDGIKKDNNITSEEQFQDALEREGLTLGELRQNIERGVLRRIVMQRDIQPKIEAGEAELLAEYEKLKATEFTKAPTVTLQEILVAEGPGAEALAREVAARARAGEDFADLARAHSAAPSRAQGGDIGQFSSGRAEPRAREGGVRPRGRLRLRPPPRRGGLPDREGDRQDLGEHDPLRRRQGEGPRPGHDVPLRGGLRRLHRGAPQDAVVELRVREVPLQLTGPIPEGSLLEALEPLAPGADPGPGPASTAPRQSPRPSARGRRRDHHDAPGRAGAGGAPAPAPPPAFQPSRPSTPAGAEGAPALARRVSRSAARSSATPSTRPR
jgi:parvulin-like peptidyl-prolyl isomerase